MSRITPATGTILDLEDDEPYRVHLVGQPVLVDSKPEYGGAKRLELTWRLSEGDPEDTLKDWMGLKLGQNSAGEVAKLRMLLNALAGKPKETPVAWFDDETFEWGYDDQAFGKLSEGFGFELVIRGETRPKADGTGPRFNIEKYQPVKREAAAAPPAPAQDDYQYTPDRLHRWKAGMAAWEPVPAAAPPAPPAAAAAPPPPPPAAASAAPPASASSPAASGTGRRRASSSAPAAPAAPPPPPAAGAPTEPPF